ncbi:AmmeMemoRadiSam system protein A [Actinomyces ruminis]|uniref:AmmeMemoRadiSam system protein A n=1 Tax=Actinomyces ruminis TaxID=1937003 RepID=UPI001C558489|nr:AmmeMemoRadiSam system protein A [Actinomyces ruminis]
MRRPPPKPHRPRPRHSRTRRRPSRPPTPGTRCCRWPAGRSPAPWAPETGAPAELLAGERPTWLDRPGAAFVTLRAADGSLRGCIGSLEAHRPLGDDVVANAIAAALRDPRFPPVTAMELPALHLEVSVLTAPEVMEARDEQEVRRRLRPGVDGVVLSLGARRATFLPQVWEELPDPADFLRQLKRKAGWPAGFWDADLVVETYRVRAWEES